MDGVYDTPNVSKRRKLGDSDVSQGKEYDSGNDSGDSLFDGCTCETIATLPLENKATPTPTQPSYITQPTQIIGHQRPTAIVQVPGSSPSRPGSEQSATNSPIRKGRHVGGILASAMAPPGTAFRPPQGVFKAPPSSLAASRHIINLSDSDEDVPRYQGASSDEDTQTARRADIKPSSFKSSVQQPIPGGSTDKFKSTLANSHYKPVDSATKPSKASFSGSIYDSRIRDDRQTQSQFAFAQRSDDVMANAYGGSARSNRPVPMTNIRQSGPAKAISPRDINLEEIDDYQARTKVARMRNILPNQSILNCYNALLKKKGNFDDAMDLLISIEEQSAIVDLVSGDEQSENRSQRRLSIQKKHAAKQQIKAPNQSIQERWAATQRFQNSGEKVPTSPLAASKPRRRLVQGRKGEPPATSPPCISSPRSTTPTSESDSGIGSELEDTASEGKLLEWFNTCSISDLADCAATSEAVAHIIISQRPFNTLQDVRQISEGKKGEKSKKAKLIGDKIVDKCLDMWTGYDAIDKLVEQCSELGEAVKKEMEKWGLNFMGASSSGELEMAELEAIHKSRDSGVGTPTSRDVSADEEVNETVDKGSRKHRSNRFLPQPSIMAPGVTVKDYQLVGMNWLALLFGRGLSCILADDMGLGKTCQVIAFLAHLLETGTAGPHLIIVPGSTLENWLREFKAFCPKLRVTPYYAGQKERPSIQTEIEENIASINVVVTTYGIAKVKQDNSFLRKLKPVCTIYDEGHILRNSKSAGYEQYMRIPCQFRLLLTGTPLQNNLRELASLLGFILPSLFKEHSEALEAIFSHKAKTSDNEESHAALLSAQRIGRAKTMMTPFVLRRKKHQVLKYLPAKHRRVQYCDLSISQRQIYDDEKARAIEMITRREAGEKTGSESTNVMMSLRKASIHPLLFRQIYNDEVLAEMSKACLKEAEFAESNINLVFEDMSVMTDMELHQFCDRYPDSVGLFRLDNDQWMDSGKVEALTQLLLEYKTNGDRVLVFSQFVMVLNILEYVMETLDMQFFRLDGSTKIDERQDMIDQFYKEPEITVFLLSTGAGGAGINLACANKVIIFDSSFNPQTDIQAENRAHRVGQVREVEVVRLITRGTIEEQIHALGETKLALDHRVGGFTETENSKAEKEGQKIVAEIMMGQIKDESASVAGVIKE